MPVTFRPGPQPAFTDPQHRRHAHERCGREASPISPLVTGNGLPAPLHPTATRGLPVAGVRDRAWPPSSSIHPTIGIHHPATFDVVDVGKARSLGGCRVEDIGPTPRPVDVDARLPAAVGPAHDYPRTLDLRRVPGAGRTPPPG